MTEARYANFERGSLEWVLEKFFDDQNDPNPKMKVYKVKEDYLAIYANQHIIDLVEMHSTGPGQFRPGVTYVYPLIGNSKRVASPGPALAQLLIIFRKDRVHPG